MFVCLYLLFKYRQAFFIFFVRLWSGWEGVRKTALALFFLTAWLPPTLSTIQRFLYKILPLLLLCFDFFLIFGRYARSGFPMDCYTFHSQSLTQNKSDVPSLPLGRVCLPSHRLNEKLLGVSPRQIPLYCRLPSSSEEAQRLQNNKRWGIWIFYKLFLTHGEKLYKNFISSSAEPTFAI